MGSVSIQLVSPASGDPCNTIICHPPDTSYKEQIRSPKEHGPRTKRTVPSGFHVSLLAISRAWSRMTCSRVSIQLVSPASGDLQGTPIVLLPYNVSIQLVSPASGDEIEASRVSHLNFRFHSIGIPSEWGLDPGSHLAIGRIMFPFNWYPQRVGIARLLGQGAGSRGAGKFPFNWYPQRVGISPRSCSAWIP